MKACFNVLTRFHNRRKNMWENGFPHVWLADVVLFPCRMLSLCSLTKILHSHTHQEGAE